jgi:hypothetical protein
VAVAPLVAGCVAGSADESPDTRDDAINPRYGVDYAWARPSASHLKSEGYTFVARYLSYDTTGKNLTAGEVSALKAAGIDIVANWEWGADDALDGFNRGVEHAKAADKQAAALGMPSDRPIYFSCDFDATPGQQAAIDAYMDGVASVIGRSRTGAYGGYYVIKRLFDHGKITWGWQTYAWSGGQWDSRAQVRQIQNGIEGGQLDKDEAVAADFGQWSHSSGGGGNPTPPPSSTCSMHSDGKLYCDNKDNSAMHAQANSESSIVNYLRTTHSWFDCWGTGELHAGGNHTWYHTLGDDNGNKGWVPAVDLSTTSAFDANPSAHGLKQCASLPPLPANCNVHSDGKLYCANTAHSAMHKSSTAESTVVNHLETTNSWFKCWGTGELHAGGNHTWYYTLGDDNGNWGWVPAVDLSTPSSFDANPGAYGLPSCN